MDDSGWRSRIRWVVVHPDRPALLLVERAGALALPETELPAKVWTADAKAILPALRELVGFDAVLLGCVREHEDEAALVLAATLMATPRAAAPPGPGARWAGREDLVGAAFPRHDQAMVAVVLDELAEGPAGSGRAPWAARGWFQAAEGWLRGSLDTIGDVATGPVQQVQLWELSCILRVPTVRGDVWFKASRDSPLFVNEAVLTRELAGLFPDHVPAPVAVDAERRWMALRDFGAELGWDAPVEVREDVLRTFARLQVRAAPQVDRLLGAGDGPARRDRRRDLAVGRRGGRAGRRRAPAGGDVRRARGLRRPGHAAPRRPAPVERGQGPRRVPVLRLERRLCHPPVPRHDHGLPREGRRARDRLRDAYLAEWTRFEPPDRLRRAWELAEPLGALHHAVSYRSIVANLDPPIDLHMMQSTAYWLRKVIAGLRRPLL